MVLSICGILYESNVLFSLFITFTSAPSSKSILTNSRAFPNCFSSSNFFPMTSKTVLPFASLILDQSSREQDAFSLRITSFISLILRNQFSHRSPAETEKITVSDHHKVGLEKMAQYVSDLTNLFKHIHILRVMNTYHTLCGPSLTHTVCFDVSIYRQIGEPDVTNKRMTHLLKLDTFFHTHDA